jgi:hypothetical protein
MPSSYENAFGLTDNPFSPKIVLPGVKSGLVMKSIYINPLRLDDDDGLMQLYVGDAGPFDLRYQEYSTKLQGEGYVHTNDPGKPLVGINSFIFFIHGPIGTGKSTLMNLMIRWLKLCQPPNGDWLAFKAQFNLRATEAQQMLELERLKDRIEKKAQPGDYCYAVLDNLTEGASETAFDLYKYFEEKFQLCMFVTTSDSELRQNTWSNWPLPILPYQTSELGPDEAVAFVRSRVSVFRDPKTVAALGHGSLFPFEEQNIRAAVKTKTLAYNSNTNIITIRQFSQALTTILERWLPTSPVLFNGGVVTAAQLDDAKIDLIAVSKQIIEKFAA